MERHVTREDFSELKEIVRSLGDTMGELADAQQRTQEELRQLVVDHRETRRQLGGMTMAVEYGIEVESVGRENVPYRDGGYLEVNILARGSRSGKPVYLVGECKSQPGKNDLKRFHRLSERIREVLDGEVLCFLVGYVLDPSVVSYAEEHCPHIRLFKTYEFELRYHKLVPPARDGATHQS